MIEWLFAFMVTFIGIVIVPLLINIHSENLRLRKIIDELTRGNNERPPH